MSSWQGNSVSQGEVVNLRHSETRLGVSVNRLTNLCEFVHFYTVITYLKLNFTGED